MRTGFISLLLLLSVSFASAKTSAVPAPRAPVEFWLKRYPPKAFGAYWHVDLEVKKLPKVREKIFALMQKYGGLSTLPLASLPVSADQKFQQQGDKSGSHSSIILE